MKAIFPTQTPEGLAFTPMFTLEEQEQLVFLGNLTPTLPSGEVPRGIEEQTAACFANLDRSLENVGEIEIVKATRLMTDLREAWASQPAFHKYLGDVNPTSTLLEVATCSVPGARIELEAWGVAKDPQPGGSDLSRVAAANGAPSVVFAGWGTAIGALHVAPGAATGSGAEAELSACLDAIDATATAANEGAPALVKLTVYTNEMREWPACRAAIEARYGGNLPALNPVAVQKLGAPEATIEVDGWFAESSTAVSAAEGAASLGAGTETLVLSGTAAIDIFVGGKAEDMYHYKPERDIEAQTRVTLKNYACMLEAAGASWDDVVKTTWYMTDRREWPAVEAVSREAFGRDLPAPSVVEISRFVMPGVRLEPDMWVRLPS